MLSDEFIVDYNWMNRQLSEDSPMRFARHHSSESPLCPHCGSDDTFEPKSGRKPRLHECRDCREEFNDAESDAALKPGQETTDGGHFEPEAEPDLEQFVINKVGGGEASPSINHGTGFITRAGEGIQMGSSDTRCADHREAIPTHTAMKRWGWPEDIIRDYEEGTRTPALYETMKRSGLVRFHSDSTGGMTVSLAVPPTKEQIAAIEQHAIRSRPRYVVIAPRNGDEIEIEGHDIYDLGKFLKRAAKRIK